MLIIWAPLLPLVFFPIFLHSDAIGNGVVNFAVVMTAIILFLLSCYLVIRTFFVPAFILDKNATPLESIQLSFQATRSNVLELIALLFLLTLILFISILPFGIGLIWTIPLLSINYGIVYKK